MRRMMNKTIGGMFCWRAPILGGYGAFFAGQRSASRRRCPRANSLRIKLVNFFNTTSVLYQKLQCRLLAVTACGNLMEIICKCLFYVQLE